ncbi:MAG TPA: SH3 domain-containing protein [Thioalkalivibrio sp.]|nr:SH3 domain-containing protein [Thioalkalivibrio sp.]
MKTLRWSRAALAAMASAGIVLMTGCATNQTTLGGGSTMVTGSGGGAGAQGQNQELFRCATPVGTAALLEPDYPIHASFGLSSPVPLVRLLMTQSNCFRVVERGAASSALQRERALAAGGELQRGSAMGGGQMAAADFIITPSIIHSDSNAGGSFGGLGGLLPGSVGIIAGGIRTTQLESQVMLTLVNVRTGVQEAVAEGSASKSDIDFGGGGVIGVVAGLGGSYQSTDIGKITAAAFLDAHNKLARQLGAIPVGAAAVDSAGYLTSATVNLRGGPSVDSPVLGSLPAGTAVSPTGTVQGTWWQVEAQGRTGWVHSDYITR